MTLVNNLQRTADRWAPAGMAISFGTGAGVTIVETFHRVAIGDTTGATVFGAMTGGAIIAVAVNLIDFARARGPG